MSRFLAMLLDSARSSTHGMTTGAPAAPVRHTWPQVHATARRMAAALQTGEGGTAAVGRGTAVGVLAGDPAVIAPAAQGVWLSGGSVTMLHQPTARTDLTAW